MINISFAIGNNRYPIIFSIFAKFKFFFFNRIHSWYRFYLFRIFLSCNCIQHFLCFVFYWFFRIFYGNLYQRSFKSIHVFCSTNT